MLVAKSQQGAPLLLLSLLEYIYVIKSIILSSYDTKGQYIYTYEVRGLYKQVPARSCDVLIAKEHALFISNLYSWTPYNYHRISTILTTKNTSYTNNIPYQTSYI